MITIAQCRAARGLLDWTQQDLAEASGLSKTAINNFEKGHSDIKSDSLRAVRMAFESADIEFMPNGLRRKSEAARIIKGPEAINDLFNDIFETLKDGGGELLLAGVNGNLKGHVEPGQLSQHATRMRDQGITARILGEDDSLQELSELDAEYRSLRHPGIMVAVYGPKVALELWDSAMIVILSSADAADAERLRFEHLWNSADSAKQSGSKEKAGRG